MASMHVNDGVAPRASAGPSGEFPMRKLLITAALVALAGPVFAKPTPETGAPLLQPTPEQGEAAIWATRFLTRFHYQPTALDDAMSAKILDAYIEALDGDRLFFLQADINRFEPYRDRLDDAIYEQDLTSAYAIFNLYQQRVAERVAHARAVLARDPDFSGDESYDFDREDAAWPKDTAEVD